MNMYAFMGLPPVAWLLGAGLVVAAVVVTLIVRKMKEEDQRRCPNCDQPVPGESVLCESCGEFLGEPRSRD
jgi:hypothetical protein